MHSYIDNAKDARWHRCYDIGVNLVEGSEIVVKITML